MRNREFTNTVLELMRQHKTNKEIAEITNRHRNTVSIYVNYIRKNIIRKPEETVNKIDSKLDERMESMTDRDLIAYRRAITPQKIEAKSVEELREIKIECVYLEPNIKVRNHAT